MCQHVKSTSSKIFKISVKWCAGKAQGDGMGRLGGRRVQDGEHVIFFYKKKKQTNKQTKKSVVILLKKPINQLLEGLKHCCVQM